MSRPAELTKRCATCTTPHHMTWTECQKPGCSSKRMNRRTPLNSYPAIYVDEKGIIQKRPVAPKMVKCSGCGTQNAVYRPFCRNCGAPMPPNTVAKKPSKTTLVKPQGSVTPVMGNTSPPTVEDRITALDEKLDKILTIVEELKIQMWAKGLDL